MARKVKGIGYQVKVERTQVSWFQVYGVSGQKIQLLGCPMGRSWNEESALKDFIERINAENRLNWKVTDLVVSERIDYVTK